MEFVQLHSQSHGPQEQMSYSWAQVLLTPVASQLRGETSCEGSYAKIGGDLTRLEAGW